MATKLLGDTSVNPLVTTAISLTEGGTYLEQASGDGYVDVWPTIGQVLAPRIMPGGRLSLKAGVPVPGATEDLTARSVIFYPHHASPLIPLADANDVWQVHAIPTDLQLLLSGLTSGAIYDVFGGLDEDDAVTLTRGDIPWTSNFARGIPLTRLNGKRVMASDHTKLYLGSFVATGEDTTADDAGQVEAGVFGRRLLANEYHRVLRRVAMHATDATGPPYQYGHSPDDPVLYMWPSGQYNVIGPTPTSELPDGASCLDGETMWRVQVLALGAQDVRVSADIATAIFGAWSAPWENQKIFAVGVNVDQQSIVGQSYVFASGDVPALTWMDVGRQFVHLESIASLTREGLHSIYPLIKGTGSGGSGSSNQVVGASAASVQYQSGLVAMVEN